MDFFPQTLPSGPLLLTAQLTQNWEMCSRTAVRDGIGWAIGEDRMEEGRERERGIRVRIFS